jgi:gluconokinase
MASVTIADAQAPFILTLDIGSSSTRAMLFDARARSIDGLEAREVHTLHTEPDSTAIDRTDELLARIVNVIDRVIILVGDRSRDIGAVAIDTYASNLLGLDRSSQPITPIFTYADTRPTEDAAKLREQYNETSVLDRTGCLIRSSYLPARLMWLKRTQPQVLQDVKRWVSIGEYLLDQFFGKSTVSTSIASWSGLLNRRTLNWDSEWFKSLPVSIDQMGSLVDVSDSTAGLQPEWAARWPMLKDVPWFPAIGDGAAANIGSGCTSPDRIALTIGTSGAMRVTLNESLAEVSGNRANRQGIPPRGSEHASNLAEGARSISASHIQPPQGLPFGLWCYRIDRSTSLLGGATNEGGNVYAWLRQTLLIDTDDKFDAAINALEPDAHGLTALPFIAGERSPGYVGDVRATIHGLSLSTQPIEIARAMLEAVAYRFAIIHQRIESAYPPGSFKTSGRIIASGGGLLRRPAWLQIFADVLNRSVIASAEKEATSRGAALIALRSIGTITSLDELPADLGETYEPHSQRHAIYLKAIERQQKLYDLLITNH